MVTNYTNHIPIYELRKSGEGMDYRAKVISNRTA